MEVIEGNEGRGGNYAYSIFIAPIVKITLPKFFDKTGERQF